MPTSKISNRGQAGALADEKATPSPDFRLLIDSAPALIHTGLPDGYLDFFNQAWLDYVGRSLEDLLGWRWTEYIHPEDVEGIVQKWRASLASGEPFLYETRVRRADGVYRWMLHHKVGVRDEYGNIVKWHGSSIDIEDRKRAEEQLRRSAQELQRSEFYLAEAQRLAHMGTWVFDPARGFEYWSRELFYIHGLDPAKGPPGSEEYLELVHPEDRESMASLMKRMVAELSGFDVTKRIVRPDGELRYVRCVGSPIVDSGTMKRIGMGMDVTENELLTRELRRREAYLAEAQRLSHTGSFGWKPDSEEIVWSDETYRIFEYDPTLMLAIDSIAQRVHPEDRAEFQEVIDRASAGATHFEHAYRLLLPDGRMKHVHALAHALTDACGNREFVGAVTDISEQRQAETALRESEASLQFALDTSEMGEWKLDLARRAAHRSLRHDRIFGYETQLPEWTYEKFMEHVLPEDRQLVDRKFRQALEAQSGWNFECRIVRSDQAIRWIWASGRPRLDAQGKLKYLAGIVQDITERKRAEEALRQSENYLAEAQRLTHMGSWAWQVAGRDALHLSDEWYRIYGFDPKHGMPAWEERLQRVHPEDRDTWRGAIERAIREKSDYEVEFRILLPDGKLKWVHTVGHPVLSAAGELVQFVGSSMDITERKRAEAEIREQETELRQILDLVPQQVGVFAPDGSSLWANRATHEYFGIDIDQWRAASRVHFVHPDDREHFLSERKKGFLEGASFEFEARLLGHDGKFRWFLIRLNPLKDESGNTKRWYGTATDIEERKQAEDRLRRENIALREEIDQTSMFEEIVGTSRALRTVLSRISKVAPSDSTVLITGETGTGKELVARAIHRRSGRNSGAFISVNCAAIPRDLIASELFGHEKGAFTGATQRRLGRFELADGGTIFLDEVGELLPDTQVALLRVLQEREFERVGGGQPIHVNVRVIAATNRDLNAAVANGTFRQDLFYRLNVFPVDVPALKERKDDILMLVEYFVQRYAARAGKNISLIDKKTLELLQSYAWPGNIRELQNIIERSVVLAETGTFFVDESWLSPASPSLQSSNTILSKRPALQEKEIIEAALAETKGRVSGPAGAAAKLGVPSTTLESKIKSLKINKHQYKTA